MKNPAIFFDRDGIVNRRIFNGYVTTISEFELLPAFVKSFKLIKEKGYLAILITNQQGIGKGLMSESNLFDIHDYMQNQLNQQAKNKFDGIYFCSDLANSNSLRRKPEPGMLLEAIEDFDIDIAKSWFIGDSMSDVEAGNRADINTIYVNNSRDYKEWEPPSLHIPKLDLLEGILTFLPSVK